MLIAFISLIALVDFLLGWGGGLVGMEDLGLAQVFRYLFAPVAWLMLST